MNNEQSVAGGKWQVAGHYSPLSTLQRCTHRPPLSGIAVIICAYTEARWDDLVAAVTSVAAQTMAAQQIIVVIDHNKNLFRRAVLGFPKGQFPPVTVVENQEPRGLSGARNSGIAVTQSEIIAFMDEDAWAAPDWLAQLCQHYQEPSVIGVGGRIIPQWPATQPGWFPQEFNWVVGCTYKGMPETAVPVRNLIGCNMSFRREIFDEIGGFRNGMGRIGTLPVGCEETELCIRALQQKRGTTLLFEPEARVYHRVPAARASWSYFYRRCLAEGLSKAQVAALVGGEDGLSNERSYTLRTLPHGVWQGLTDACLRLDFTGVLRAGVIVAGLGLTTAGYLRGSLAKRPSPLDAASTHQPIRVSQAELSLSSRRFRTSGRMNSAADAPPVSIVIATHNRTEALAACLQSLLALDYPDYEIIVVDNAPRTTATADFMRQTYGATANVHYVYEAVPGLAVAHNRGLQEVRFPLVAFTDDDVLVDKQWLTEIVSAFQTSEHVACVTGMILPAELETAAQIWLEQYSGFNKGFQRRIFDLHDHRPADPLFPYAAGVFGSGANMAFKTAILRQLGGFDPALGAGSRAMGGDDLDIFFRTLAAGYTLVYEPAAIVHHWHQRDYASLQKQAYGYGIGLTAYLTSCLVNRPQRCLDLLPLLPQGLRHILSTQSPKNQRKQADYPRELDRFERQGMLRGPFAYLRSRWDRRHLRPSPGSPSARWPTIYRQKASQI